MQRPISSPTAAELAQATQFFEAANERQAAAQTERVNAAPEDKVDPSFRRKALGTLAATVISVGGLVGGFGLANNFHSSAQRNQNYLEHHPDAAAKEGAKHFNAGN